jgi:ABC-type transport system involved in multi-copper enzyme maturation permease subunit
MTEVMEMAGSVRAELYKLVRRPAMWTLTAVFLVLAQVFGYLIPYVAYRSGGGGGFAAGESSARLLRDVLPQSLVTNTLGGFPLFAGAIALIMGALLTGGEFGWGTLKTVLTQRPRRSSVLAGKLVAALVTALGLVVATFALNAVWGAVISSAEGRAAAWPSALELARGIGAGFLIIWMWTLFGALLGILFRSTSLSVGLGLVWTLVIETLVRGVAGLLGFLDVFQRWLPGVNAGSLVASLGAATENRPGGTPGVTAAVSGPQALVVLIAYVIVLALVGGLVLQRQDVR